MTHDRSACLRSLRGNDQIVGSARRAGAASVREEPPLVRGGHRGVVKHVNSGGYDGERAGAFGGEPGRVGHLDADAILSDRYRTIASSSSSKADRSIVPRS